MIIIIDPTIVLEHFCTIPYRSTTELLY